MFIKLHNKDLHHCSDPSIDFGRKYLEGSLKITIFFRKYCFLQKKTFYLRTFKLHEFVLQCLKKNFQQITFEFKQIQNSELNMACQN